MRLNNFENIVLALKYDVLSSSSEYKKLLKVMGNNGRYDFVNQLSIYGKNEDARACAKFDLWREKYGKTVMRGQKGIPIIESNLDGEKTSYIFDVSQTTEMDIYSLNRFDLWQYEPEHHKEKISAFLESLGIESSENVSDDIHFLVRYYSKDEFDNLINELRIDYEDMSSYNEFLENSLCYSISQRMGLNFEFDESNIDKNLSSLDSLSLIRLGNTLSSLNLEIVDNIISRTKEIKLEKVPTNDKSLRYTLGEIEEKNNDITNIGGMENDIRTSIDKRGTTETKPVRGYGEYGRDFRYDKGKDNGQDTRGQGLYSEISKSDLLNDENGISNEFRERDRLHQTNDDALRKNINTSSKRNTGKGFRVYEEDKTRDESVVLITRG